MEEEKPRGVVKHILMAKFKEGITDGQIEEFVENFSKLIKDIEPLKAFHWGKHASTFDQYDEFTHVFESTFDTMEGLAEFMIHPHHISFANMFLPNLEKVAIIDFKPIVFV